MGKHAAVIATFLAALLAIAIPVVLSLYIAHREGLESEFARVGTFAREALAQTDEASDQIDAVFNALDAVASADPCSPGHILVMEGSDLSSRYLQAVGHVSGTVMDCSSIGRGARFELGPVDVTHPSGVRLRRNVELPVLKGTHFVVVEDRGWAAVLRKQLPLDATAKVTGLTLAVVSKVDDKQPLSSSGFIDPAWIRRLQESGKDAVFVDRDHVVAVVPSRRYGHGAIAALPRSNLSRRIRAAMMVALPVGLCAGLLLAFAVFLFARRQQAMPAIIKTGLGRREFFMDYQPIVDLRSGRWIGAEALLRWRRSNGEMLRPDLFIPAAEETGLIRRITGRVAELVARDAAGLFRKYPDFRLAMNISAEDLLDPGIAGLVERVSTASAAAPGNLVMEITERALAEPQAAAHALDQLRAQGVRVAIDDFGTGYSSLSYLENFHVDCLKIDKSFIETVGTGAVTSQVAPHIIGMAKALRLEMVAEGVETEAQARFLREHGVSFAQGWLFARPMPFAELLAGLERQRAFA